MREFSRRNILAATTVAGATTAISAAARAAQFGNPDRPPEGAVNVTNPKALTNPGPQNPTMAGQIPSAGNPPPTDVNGMPMFWSSFNIMHKRIQDGGWARQVITAQSRNYIRRRRLDRVTPVSGSRCN